jgi:Tfp pilus assembly protein PilO
VKGSDKAVVLGVVMAVVLGAFYFMALSPKREKASTLKTEVSDLKAQVDQQRQAAAFGEAARKDFPAYYGRLVVMGKAVPDQADTASLMVELSAISHSSGVEFRGISLSADAGDSSGSAPAASTAPSTGTTPTTPTDSTGTTTPAATTPTPATETDAAGVPLGAVVGSASLPTMPYDLDFSGNYFQVSDFLKGVDDLVHLHGATQVAADGRLLTIDGFSLSEPQGLGANPKLKVSLRVTSYVTPATEGLTAGASPTAPAPSLTQPSTQPTSATVTP